MNETVHPAGHSPEAVLTSGWSARGVWLGAIAFVVALLGTELLTVESLRGWAALLVLGAGMLAVLAWRKVHWSAAFGGDRTAAGHLNVGRRRSSLILLGGAVLLSALSHVSFLAPPRQTFGLAGWLWLAAIVSVIVAAAL